MWSVKTWAQTNPKSFKLSGLVLTPGPDVQVEQTRRVATEKMLRPRGTFHAALLKVGSNCFWEFFKFFLFLISPPLDIFAVDAWNLLLDYSKYILPAGIFLFKFLEWWYSENRFVDTTAQAIPPAPEPPKVLSFPVCICTISSLHNLLRIACTWWHRSAGR